MRASDAFACGSAMEIRIGFAPDELSGILIYRIVCRNISEVAHRKKRRHVGVVHEELTAEAVHLIGIDLSIFRVLIYCMLLKCLLDLRREVKALFGEFAVIVYLAEDLGSLAERGHGHEV